MGGLSSQSGFQGHSMALSIGSLIFAGTVIISYFVVSQFWRLFLVSSRKPVYPPGPPARNWITGHASDLASGKIWETYTEWARTYGMMFFVSPLHHCSGFFRKNYLSSSFRRPYSRLKLIRSCERALREAFQYLLGQA